MTPVRISFNRLTFAASFALLLIFTPTAHAGWTLLRNFPEPIGCGFFFDADHGLVGSGIRTTNGSGAIYKTTDGGTTWITTTTPNIKCVVTDIFMQTPLVGYASIFGATQTVWKTTNGGDSWFDFTFGGQNRGGEQDGATCVYATPTAVILTRWGSVGGFTTNGGSTFTQVFTGARSDYSNGIDFTDDLHGVVTVGPELNNTPVCFYTANGGSSWNRVRYLPESWGVYGVKGTSTFFTAGEGDGQVGNPQHSVFRSTDGGANWSQIFLFTDFNMHLTGHIAGMAQTIYVQTESHYGTGLYRSDNLGVTWKPVGGPSHSRDTRFVVTGCSGEVVYAFDESGNVYKTTDGGDGSLSASTPGNALAVSSDTLTFNVSNCNALRQTLRIQNLSCSATIFDSVALVSDSLGVFNWTNISSTTMSIGGTDSIIVNFSPAKDGGDTAYLVIHGHSGGQPVDKTIVLAGFNNASPQPEMRPIQPARAGEVVSIPIYLTPTEDVFSISTLAIHLKFNGDILTPKALVTIGTLSQNASVSSVDATGLTGASILVTPQSPITQNSDLTKPLLVLQARVTLSNSLSTEVLLDTFAINTQLPLTLCSIPEETFRIQQECGDSLISEIMANVPLGKLLTIEPNPNRGNTIFAMFSTQQPTTVSFELLDANGSIVSRPISDFPVPAGMNRLDIPTESLNSGTYFLLLHEGSKLTAVAKLVEIR